MMELNNEMTFEEAYKALEETVRAMEAPDIDFNHSLQLYEQACKLVALCQRRLGEAKIRITDINEHVRMLKENNMPIFEDGE